MQTQELVEQNRKIMIKEMMNEALKNSHTDEGQHVYRQLSEE